jgi:Tfp pilus assembly protein PilV
MGSVVSMDKAFFRIMRRAKMVSKTCKIRCRRGISLVSVLIAMAILLAALIGTSNFRYYSALDAKKAAAKITASRIGLMLCENWRGLGGIETYDPATYFGTALTITSSAGPDKPTDFTLLGSYTVTLNRANYYITLSWKDVSTGLRALNIIVTWAQRGQGTSSLNDADKSFKLTTYTS